MATQLLPSSPSLVARVDLLDEQLGDEVAQIYLASGNPSGETLEMRFADLAEEIRARARALFHFGIRRSDRVALMMPLAPKSYPTLHAAMLAATAVPLNYFLEAPALVRLLAAADATTLIVARRFEDDPASRAKLDAIMRSMPGLKVIAYGDGEAIKGALDLDAEALAHIGRGWMEAHRHNHPERVLAMFHTSGTTGRPKLVPHSEARFLAMLASGGVAMGSGPGERMLVGLPLFHVSGALQMGFQTLFNGCSIVIPSPTGLRGEGVIADYWSFISRLRVTLAGVVPTVLMKLAETKPEGDVSSLRYFLCGGAPLPRPIIEAVTRHSGGAAVIEGWGMTETCGLALLNPRDRPRMGTVGVPFMGVEAEIRRWNGKDRVSPSTMVGELVVRGETVITAYLDDQPDLFTADGWLRTGDLARQDEDGYFWIVGRAKDLIIRGGHNIDPATIEGPAYEHPAVELAAAIGRPDRYAGEVPVLYIQLRPDAHVEPAEFQGFLAKRIEERAAIPKAVHILPVMPLNAQGKISKLTLRQEATRAVLQSELDAVCPTATVAVAEDERHGLSVRIAAPPGDRSAAERALSHYPFPILEEA